MNLACNGWPIPSALEELLKEWHLISSSGCRALKSFVKFFYTLVFRPLLLPLFSSMSTPNFQMSFCLFLGLPSPMLCRWSPSWYFVADLPLFSIKFFFLISVISRIYDFRFYLAFTVGLWLLGMFCFPSGRKAWYGGCSGRGRLGTHCSTVCETWILCSLLATRNHQVQTWWRNLVQRLPIRETLPCAPPSGAHTGMRGSNCSSLLSTQDAQCADSS